MTQLYKDKSQLLEELVAAGGDLTVAKRQVQALEGQLMQVRRGGDGGRVSMLHSRAAIRASVP